MTETHIYAPYPVSANRYWRHARGKTYRSPEANRYRNAVQRAAIVAGFRRPLTGEVAVSGVLHPKRTKKGTASRRRLDIDNAIKVTLDALQGVAVEDDAQVVVVHFEVGAPVDDGGVTVEVLPLHECATWSPT